ncbi:MAG: hypothetical protein AVDCRST_MAG49-1286, partial [uncultured Thermomicrobiales bacterium]
CGRVLPAPSRRRPVPPAAGATRTVTPPVGRRSRPTRAGGRDLAVPA